MSFLRPLLHISALSAMTYGYHSLHKLPVTSAIDSQYGGHFQFLTIQGLAIAWLTMAVSSLVDFFPSASSLTSLKRALLVIALPVATIVSAIYWTLLLGFPNLILQGVSTEALELYYLPLSIDLSLHAVPCASMLLDFMAFERKYTKQTVRYGAPVLASLATLWYSWWVERCAERNGSFPYPFLTINSFDVRMVIYAAAGAFAYFSFYALNALHSK